MQTSSQSYPRRLGGQRKYRASFLPPVLFALSAPPHHTLARIYSAASRRCCAFDTTGELRERFTAAVVARNERVVLEGEPELAPYCDESMCAYDNRDGTQNKTQVVSDGTSANCVNRHSYIVTSTNCLRSPSNTRIPSPLRHNLAAKNAGIRRQQTQPQPKNKPPCYRGLCPARGCRAPCT